MTTIVVFDSRFGNTEKIARAVCEALTGDVKVVRADQLDPGTLSQMDLLVIGSPTHGGRPTEAVKNVLSRMPEGSAKGLRAASFDTRIPGRFPKIFGYAADRIERELVAKGAVMVAPPEPFYVTGREGPLKDGELEHAAAWARGLKK